MDFLNNKFSQTFKADGSYKMGCLLNPKGRLVDTVGVGAIDSNEAYMLTSPGHFSTPLFERLDPLIFPMDQVKLKDWKDARILSVASSRLKDVKKCFKKHVLPMLEEVGQDDLVNSWRFPSPGQIRRLTLKDGSPVLVFPTPSILPSYAAFGYTIAFLTNDNGELAKLLFRSLVSENNPDGPIELGPREFETFRIEAGVPAFGHEFSVLEKQDDGSKKTTTFTPASPLELHIGPDMIDSEKGCYLGQEGVASMMKNPRGPPRLLYSVVFEDELNLYQYETEGDGRENLTRLPEVGDELFVLGSNEEISVGRITSVGEPGGTGDRTTIGLCLIRRSDSVLSRMKALGLEVSPPLTIPEGHVDMEEEEDWDIGENMKASSKLFPKAPVDKLDGLDVIIGGTFTIGRLKSVPSRQGFPPGLNMFEDVILYDDIVGEASKLQSAKTGSYRKQETGYLQAEANARRMMEEGEEYPWDVIEKNPNAKVKIESKQTLIEVGGSAVEEDDEEDEDDELKKQIEQAEAEAAAAEAEAKRKAEKMEMLRKRAEAAM
eukprot:CAMPEP_0194042656 /NCGR_PEP_ID=MMETSP0009_2-20130614/14412_1 /TAXON_ID=210454 /ORGANISM="Grammatophora oceanica, Strain CCMP 410" /LENGTH=545 /DNA_ID=CAMNT_0038686587 /DNA_START=69 /DNA_END=1703 /DNA_ORIENTATION=+